MRMPDMHLRQRPTQIPPEAISLAKQGRHAAAPTAQRSQLDACGKGLGITASVSENGALAKGESDLSCTIERSKLLGTVSPCNLLLDAIWHHWARSIPIGRRRDSHVCCLTRVPRVQSVGFA